MGNSLKDQLLKLGLVSEQKVRQAKQEQRAEERQQQGKKTKPRDERREQLLKEQAAKAERDRELNRKRQEETERKAAAAQIKQMIESGRLPKGDGEVAYNFIDGGKVRRLYVNPAVHGQLVSGSATIVKLRGRYDIVPKELAERIRERDAVSVVSAELAPEEEVDEAYAKYQVPDDLMW